MYSSPKLESKCEEIAELKAIEFGGGNREKMNLTVPSACFIFQKEGEVVLSQVRLATGAARRLSLANWNKKGPSKRFLWVVHTCERWSKKTDFN